jgi:predicted ATPase
MKPCECQQEHRSKRIVLTGGPGAGKTAVLELIRQHFCEHIRVLPEAASILFGGGFPRGQSAGERKASQRAIFAVQRQLESSAEAANNAAIVLCDRGTVDGFAYWPGPEDFWREVGTTRVAELRRYAAVIHLRPPAAGAGYNHLNPLRIESAGQAAVIDERIFLAWEGHPRRFLIESAPSFLEKAARALEVIREELPPCCRGA